MEKDTSGNNTTHLLNTDITTLSKKRREYLIDWGFRDAASHNANPYCLRECLSVVYADYKQGTKSREKECLDNMKELKVQNEILTREINDIKEKEIKPKKDTINRLNFEFSDIELHPEKYEIESEFRLSGFIIGSVLSVLLSIYLIIFYSSSSYSAFVKNLGLELQSSVSGHDITVLFNTIFDPMALHNASKSGTFGLFWTILFPVIFVAMGFLLHVFSTRKQSNSQKIIRTGSLLSVVFGADVIIAYKITMGIYEAKYLTGLVADKWKVSMVIKDVNFYLVILAGFAAYLIWGVLLNYVMEEYKNSRYVKVAKKQRQEQVSNLEHEIQKLESTINNDADTINTNDAKIGKLENLLHAQIISLDDLYSTFDTFFSGWTNFITQRYRDDYDLEGSRKIKESNFELDKYKAYIRSGLTSTDSTSTIIENDQHV